MHSTIQSKTKFEGITEDAARLNVCRTHLYRVLTGKRESKSLLKRYENLKKRKA
jgi:hypothetical protein